MKYINIYKYIIYKNINIKIYKYIFVNFKTVQIYI